MKLEKRKFYLKKIGKFIKIAKRDIESVTTVAPAGVMVVTVFFVHKNEGNE